MFLLAIFYKNRSFSAINIYITVLLYQKMFPMFLYLFFYQCLFKSRTVHYIIFIYMLFSSIQCLNYIATFYICIHLVFDFHQEMWAYIFPYLFTYQVSDWSHDISKSIHVSSTWYIFTLLYLFLWMHLVSEYQQYQDASAEDELYDDDQVLRG